MIRIRDYKNEDKIKIVQLANNKNVSRYLFETFPSPYTKADAEWWVEIGSKEGKTITKAIEYEGEFVGTIGLGPKCTIRRHIAEIGYWIGEPFWGKGIATEAVNQMMKIAFGFEEIKKVISPIYAQNKASMRVVEKNGFKLEGILRNENIKHGEYFDVFYYAKIKEE